MRFLANENFPRPSIRRLRSAGYDVASILEESPGLKDREVLLRAVREGRCLLTLDRDYGELIFRHGLRPPPGILYFRFTPDMSDEFGDHLLSLLAQPTIVLLGQLSVLDRYSMRQRPPPPGSANGF